MKKCIWCSKTSNQKTFNKKAHSIPRGLGGKEICENVCDECNHYFGNKNNKSPSIEEAIKETFHLSRLRFLLATGDIGKNKAIQKTDSLYFKIDVNKPSIRVKPSYAIRKGFQENLCRQLKRGLFKMFLEESERQFQNGHDSKFDFIREYARYGFGDFPVFYYQRKYGIIFQSIDYVKSPKLFMKPEERQKYLISDYGFWEFEFMSHVFGIPIVRNWQIGFDVYIKESEKLKSELFTGYKVISQLNDIDLSLSILNNKN